MSGEIPLHDLEHWMQEVITHPGGVREGEAVAAAAGLAPGGSVDSMVRPSAHLTSEERIGIYARSYWLRLVDILADDYPAVKFALGDEHFAQLVREYLTQRPSRHWSLNVLGRGLSEFIGEWAEDWPSRDFLLELARLEWAWQEVFDAERADGLEADEVLALPQERWAAARFELIPASRLFEFEYPVNGFISALRAEEEPELPGRRRSFVLVHRRNFRVFRRDLTVEQHALLVALKSGVTLGEALESCLSLPGVKADELASSLSGWFQKWAASGLFRAVSE